MKTCDGNHGGPPCSVWWCWQGTWVYERYFSWTSPFAPKLLTDGEKK